MTGDEIHLSIIYCQLYPLRCSNGKECSWRRSLEGELTTEKCVQVGHAPRFAFDSGRKKDPFRVFMRGEEVDSGVALAKPGEAGNRSQAKGYN